jgi:beta-glucuronidase
MLYPVLTDSRLLVDLSGIWDFKLDQNGEGFDERWYEGPLENAMTMPVPSSYNDIKEGMDFREHYGWVFYQTVFHFPAGAMQGQRVLLRCDAVTHHAIIFLNGQQITQHRGGFLPFEVEIGDALVRGENRLTIAVDNRIDYTTLPVGGEADMLSGVGPASSGSAPVKKRNHPNFDFFNYAGITRPVKIYTTPKDYIKDLSVVPSVPGLGKEEGPLTAMLTYKIGTAGTGEASISVYDREGREVASAKGAEGTLTVPDCHLWEPAEPIADHAANKDVPEKAYLYRIEARFGDDVYELPYGIRTVRVEGTKFLINEKPFYFKGYGKHEDSFPCGRGQNLPLWVKDLDLMRWQGANSFRTSHYPYSEEMLRLCDEEGIVVIDETPGVGINFDFGGGASFQGQRYSTFDPEHGVKTAAHHREVLREEILRDQNHACVVMWSIANEPDAHSDGAYEYFKPLFDLAREVDPQKRPCTMISVQGGGATPGPDSDVSAKLSDVICLNRYYGWYSYGGDLDAAEEGLTRELESWQKLGKPLMFTEYGADTVMGLHDTTPVMFTEEYQVAFYERYSKVFDRFDFVVGEQVWNFADFATSQGIVRVQGNKKGLFTRDRRPKLAAHWMRNRWLSIPNFGYKN